ncbi:DUF4238 domain-containing protein [Arthrobacter sp. 35W]|uniref:DUF4238 domain-containing protein n=1 Tax=Arthrobacter sp. 35W TaxID=1132441 RepID=UPI0018CA8AF6|nr:DUF4238 domain-containing protein [Arthrobacter sp. 35W]
MERLIVAAKEYAKTRETSWATADDDLDIPEIQALVAKARNNEKSAPRKHHVVPASYLRRWTENKQLRVTNVDEQRSWTTAAERAARVTDFYSMASEDLDPAVFPPLYAETQLSEVEASGKKAIDELLRHGLSDADPTTKDNLATFLGFQHVRGAGPRERSQAIANESFLLQYGEMSDEKLGALIGKGGLPATKERLVEVKEYIASVRIGSVQIEQQTPEAVSKSFLAAMPVAEELSKRHWVIYRTPRLLITCDEPVVSIGGLKTSRALKTGTAEAWVVIFPLAPDALLAMFKHPPQPHWLAELSTIEIVEINHEVLANSHKLAFEIPSRRMAEALSVPRASAALEVIEHPIEGDESRSFISFHIPSRWKDSPTPPPWPVERWYRNSPF